MTTASPNQLLIGSASIVTSVSSASYSSATRSSTLSRRAITRALWEKMPECIVIFPDGVRVVPLLLPGTVEIAEASAVELEKSRVISWSHHGIFVSEESPDKIFGLVETVEKAASIHRRVLSAGGPKRAISDEILRALADKFGSIMVAKPDWIDG